MAHVGRPLLAREQRLGSGWLDPPQFARVHRNFRGFAQPGREPFGLIEFAFAFFQRMQRHRNDHVPMFLRQGRPGGTNQQIGQERFKPERALVFIAMDDIEHQVAGDDRRPRGLEVKLHFPAVGAFKACCNLTFIRQAATLTERRPNEAHALPAVRSDVAFVRRR